MLCDVHLQAIKGDTVSQSVCLSLTVCVCVCVSVSVSLSRDTNTWNPATMSEECQATWRSPDSGEDHTSHCAPLEFLAQRIHEHNKWSCHTIKFKVIYYVTITTATALWMKTNLESSTLPSSKRLEANLSCTSSLRERCEMMSKFSATFVQQTWSWFPGSHPRALWVGWLHQSKGQSGKSKYREGAEMQFTFIALWWPDLMQT